MIGGFTTTVTILKPTRRSSPYASEEVLDWSDPKRIEVEFPVSVQPLSSSEGSPERPTVVTGWQLITPPGRDLPLDPQDRVELAIGGTYNVDGDVLRFPHPTRLNTVHHLEALLELRRG